MGYTVELWGSHKDLDEDNCITGADVGTPDEAYAVLGELKANPRFCGWEWACIDGPGGRIHEENNPTSTQTDPDDSASREFAILQGMAFGTRGYNEAIGCDGDAPEENGPSAFGRR